MRAAHSSYTSVSNMRDKRFNSFFHHASPSPPPDNPDNLRAFPETLSSHNPARRVRSQRQRRWLVEWQQPLQLVHLVGSWSTSLYSLDSMARPSQGVR